MPSSTSSSRTRSSARFSFVLSVCPVLDRQAGHLAEVFQVAGNQRGMVRQRDGGNQQVRPADLFELLVRTEAVELGGRSIVNEQNLWNPGQGLLRLLKELLSALQFPSRGRLGQESKTTLQHLDFRDDG